MPGHWTINQINKLISTTCGKSLIGMYAIKDFELIPPAGASRIHSQDPFIAEYDEWLPHNVRKKILKYRNTLPWYQGRVSGQISLQRRAAENYKITDESPDVFRALPGTATHFLQLPNDRYLEPTLMIRYTKGGHFALHNDEFKVTMSDGQVTHRQATLIVYLNDDYQGGQTAFLNQKLTIEPRPGKALLYNYGKNYKQKLSYASYHTGLPVLEGTKYILLFFVRNAEFPDDIRERMRY